MLDFLRHISPALITVIGGGYLLNRLFVSRANLAALVERICDVMDQLREDCAAYWSIGCATLDEKKAEEAVLEAKIKSGVLQVNTLVDLIVDKRPDFPASARSLISS